MNGSEDVVKIFLPRQCLSHPSGMLVGNQDIDRKLCCITNIVSTSGEDAFSLAKDCQISAGRKVPLVGLWVKHSDGTSRVASDLELEQQSPGEGNEGWLVLRRNGDALPTCKLSKSWKLSPGGSTIIILYDAACLADSHYLPSSARVQCGCLQSPNLAFLVSSYLEVQGSVRDWRAHLPVEDFVDVRSSICEKVYSRLYFMLLTVLSSCCTLMLTLFQTSLFNNRVVNFLGTLPASLLQLQKKYADLASLTPTSDTFPPLRIRSRLWSHIVDTALGLALMYCLLEGSTASHLGQVLMTWANNVVCELQQLLQWLMGVPAGLKLNSQLDRFLGKFFLYHVYLWTGYLQFLKPILSDLLWLIALSGCFGLSVQLSLLQDLLSMMTLHIYCFYVYAARLYCLQLHCLGSLWRLFRGKKWNVLRKRVDSASFDVDQLFIGTLLFTILLFLLPTVALYYVVFAGLRVLVLSMQGIIDQAVSILNGLPVYAVYLWIFQPHLTTDDVQLHLLESGPQETIYLSLQLMPASLGKLWSDFHEGTKVAAKHTWVDLGHKLIAGHLVYPWIKPAGQSQQGED